MSVNVAIGVQDFSTLIENHYFYVDKTAFLKEWWDSGDSVTLITRPRRFGKTLTMSMTEQFFSMEYAGRSDLFEELEIWNDEKYRNLQGTYPVISLSFANIKEPTYELTQKKICDLIAQLYFKFDFITESNALIKEQVNLYKKIMNHMDYVDATLSLNYLSGFLYKYYGKKVIILLDEYDTPMQEAFVDGYWDELVTFTRSLFNSTFKTNPALERGIMTGITRVSKESIFSDLNNLKVVTTTSDEYATTFGFTEPEVFEALGKCGLDSEKSEVKRWYDGFIFGEYKDIYNPWSIVNYMKERLLRSYWILTSSNKLIGDIICRHPYDKKYEIEQLMTGKPIHKVINENITFQYLDGDENSLWSLLLAVGYIKAENVVKDNEWTECDVSVTNKEVMSMFRTQIVAMFSNGNIAYENFTRALIRHRTWDMIGVMEDIAEYSMSYFDTAKNKGKHAPENFYHGLVLGLIVSMRKEYRIVSNRESGDGRYDIAIYPFDKTKDAYILEFKVLNEHREKTVQETAQNALKQIRTRNYESDLLAYGIPADHIYKLGFGFLGKKVWVVSDPPEKDEKDQVRSEWDNLRFR